MRQSRINRMVARATGEDLREIRRMGFTIADPARVGYDPEPKQRGFRKLDWDVVRRERSHTNV
jgi:hypothetical protein